MVFGSYISKENQEEERRARVAKCGSDNTGAKIAFSQVSATQTQNRTGFWVFWLLDLELWALVDSLQSACTTKTENNNRCTGVCSSRCLRYTTRVCGVIHILISGPGQEKKKKSNWIMNTSEAPFSPHPKTRYGVYESFSVLQCLRKTSPQCCIHPSLLLWYTWIYADFGPASQAIMVPLD